MEKNEKNNYALVRKPTSAIEKAAPGAKRILSGMVADALSLHKLPLVKIVILDSEPVWLDFMSDIIRSEFGESVEILAFNKSDDGLKELLSQPSPDLLFLALRMPGLDSHNILRILKRRIKTAYPILLMSGDIDFSEDELLFYTGENANAKIIYKDHIVGSPDNFFTELRTALKIPGTTLLEALAVTHAKRAEKDFDIGIKYKRGNGVVQDFKKAAKNFRRAAEQGNTNAFALLGMCYEAGEGVQQNYIEAVKWYRKAGEQGNADAQIILGNYYMQGGVVPQDIQEAIKWLRRAAEQGSADGQSCLGMCYSEGQGVTQNYTEAAKWYRLAAEQNDAGAQYELGFLFAKGEGVGKDFPEAYKFYKLATDQKQENAVENLKHIMTRMTAVEIAEGEHRYLKFHSQKI